MGLLSSGGGSAAGCCGPGGGATRVDRTSRTPACARYPRAATVPRRRASHRPERGAQPSRRRREVHRAARSARAGAPCLSGARAGRWPVVLGYLPRGAARPVAPREETAVKTRDLAYVALFAAVIAVLGTIPAIPVGPVPITAQTLGVMLAGAVLGARRGFLAVLLFLVLVALALPFLPGDLFKAFVAAAIADVVRRSYPVIERPRRAADTR